MIPKEEPEEYEPDFQEDLAFLNQLEIERSYVGTQKPQVERSSEDSRELWVVEDGRLEKRIVPESELPEYSLVDVDNDPANGENKQGWE